MSPRRVFLVALLPIAALALGMMALRPLVPAEIAPVDQQSATGFFQLGGALPGLGLGQPVPELSTKLAGATVTVTDLDGRPISVAAYRGRPLWIVFWATWCPPCQREVPDLVAAYEAHRSGGLVLLAVSVEEPAATVAEFARAHALPYPIGLDPSGAVTRRYGVYGLPTHFFIDRDGVLRDLYLGPLTREAMERRIERIGG